MGSTRLKAFFYIHKGHVDWMIKFPPQHPRKGEELVRCSKARKESALLLLNLGFDDRLSLLSRTLE